MGAHGYLADTACGRCRNMPASLAFKGKPEGPFPFQELQSQEFESFSARVEVVRLSRGVKTVLLDVVKALEDEVEAVLRDTHAVVSHSQQDSPWDLIDGNVDLPFCRGCFQKRPVRPARAVPTP